ncbi:hypothetical protein B0A50_00969 [Salinomyces thailandicus]|uniref:Centromere protein S n=1 Tax=Salinomyces thailandicus TaxID=706561 RepID=A0A4U0UBX3_9PEZI|nr:hypothetical protein B0A50_00969 [Salinomyces thailandica]
MPGLHTQDDTTKEEQLKAALWYSIGKMVDIVTLDPDLNATPHFIGGLSELVWAQIANAARDLEDFAKHAGRSTINSKDVILLGRRNDGLEEVLKAQSKSVKETSQG